MKTTITRWLKPIRMDGYLWFLLTYTITVLLTITVGSFTRTAYVPSQEIIPLFAPMAGIGVCAFALAGTWTKSDLIRRLPLLIAVVAIFWFGFLISGINGFFSELTTYPDKSDVPPHTMYLALFWVMLIAFLIARLIGMVGYLFNKKVNNFEIKRVHLLIGGAVLFFVCATFINYKNSNYVNSRMGTEFDGPWTLFLVGPLVLAAIPAWIYRLIRGWFWPLLITIVYYSVLVLAVIGLTDKAIESLSVSMFCIAAFGFCFWIGSLMIGTLPKLRLKKNQDELDSESVNVPSAPRRLFPTLWGIVPAIMTVVLICAAFFCDLGIMATCKVRGCPTADSVRISRTVREMQLVRGASTNVDFFYSSSIGGLCFHSQIQQAIGPDLLRPLEKLNSSPLVAQFVSLNPGIDTAPLAKHQLMDLAAITSELSTIQMGHFLQAANVDFQECRFEPNGNVVRPAIGSRIRLQRLKTGQVGRFLSAVDFSKSKAIVEIYDNQKNISIAEWAQIVEASKHAGIKVHWANLDAAHVSRLIELTSDLQQPIDLSIHADFELGANRYYSREAWQLRLNTPIKMTYSRRPAHELFGEYWEAVWTAQEWDPQMVVIDFWENAPSFISRANELKLFYDLDPNGKPTAFYYPFANRIIAANVAKIPTIEELSFDPEWLPATKYAPVVLGTGLSTSAFDPIDLYSMLNLKHLYLSRNLRVIEFQFLSKMKKLETLQFYIPQTTSGGANPLNFWGANCPSLKQLILFGQPSRFMMKEIAQIKTLEKVTIINNSLAADENKSATNLLEGSGIAASVKVKFLPQSGYQPEPTATFRKHREQIMKRVRKKYLDEE